MIKFIKEFNIDTSGVLVGGERRTFNIVGDIGAKFELEVKSLYGYYDFKSRSISSTRKVLRVEMLKEKHDNYIVFRDAVSFGKAFDNLTLTLTAISDNCVTTKHVPYQEVRFEDSGYVGAVDDNSSIGSNGVNLVKTIAQGPAISWFVQPYSANEPSAWPTMSAVTVGSVSARGSFKNNFTLTITGDAKDAIRINRQPLPDDFLTASVVGISAHSAIPGEDQFDGSARSTKDVGSSGGVSEGTNITMVDDRSTFWAVGDRVTGNTELDAKTKDNAVTITHIDVGSNAKVFTVSENVTVANDTTLTFTPPRRYRFPANNIIDIKPGSMVHPSSNGGGSIIGSYTRNTTIQQYVDKDCGFEMVEKNLPLVNLKAIEPTGVPTFDTNGKITSQAGNICFSTPIGAEFTATNYTFINQGIETIKEISKAGEIVFKNLKAEILDANIITATIDDASATGSAALNDFDVDNKDGIMDDVSVVSGVNIDNSGGDPIVTTIASSAGTNLTLTPGGHKVQNGQTLTFTNAAKIITITGEIEVNNIGDYTRTLYLNVDRFLTITNNA